jgi:hypothetical protein
MGFPKIREKWKFKIGDSVICRGYVFVVSSVNINGTYNLANYWTYVNAGLGDSYIIFEEDEEDIELNVFCIISNLREVQ